MTQISSAMTAQRVIWTYRGMSEESIDKEFYVNLKGVVAERLRASIQSGERIWVGREKVVRIGAYGIRARLTSIEPLLANSVDYSTIFEANYRERNKEEGQDVSNFIAEIIRYPNERLGATYDSLVGIDDIKGGMERKLRFLLKPHMVETWLKNQYGDNLSAPLLQNVRDRYPLVILEGEVGSGKTALARSVGHKLAKLLNSEIVMYVVNAQVRGGGHVGELTQNISRAFDEAERCQEREQLPVMILIDEADALAQVRGTKQTHHEDDAGVNTLIQRIDRLRGRPIAVIFATNLFQSLDSAILRRATASFYFNRPNAEQRELIFYKILGPIGLSKADILDLADMTEPRLLPNYGDRLHRYTYSDITQRIIPYALEKAIAANETHSGLLDRPYFTIACAEVLPTPESSLIDKEDTMHTPAVQRQPKSKMPGRKTSDLPVTDKDAAYIDRSQTGGAR